MNRPDPRILRNRLLEDIEQFPDEPLEVNSDELLYCFRGEILPVWCKYAGIGYKVNTQPLPEFRCKTTIIFWKLEDEPDDMELFTASHDDNEL